MAPPAIPPLPADSLPVIHIVTEGQAPILSRTEYLSATLLIFESPDSADPSPVPCEIRGRGHSSFSTVADLQDYKSKNSYRIKLSQKANLLGVGETADRDWILLSGKYDASALRNFLAWDLAKAMGSLPYVPACAWVEVYLNGDYRGLYTLCETVEVASDRVDIDDSPSTAPSEVGYLVEFDLRGSTRAGALEGLTYFYLPEVSRDYEWVIKSEVYTRQETAAVQAHLLSCHEAILSGDRERIASLVDLASLVDMFLLQELSKNPDVGTSSFYVQRDRGGKLYLTAPWDFDFAFGTYSESVSPVGLVADGKDTASHPWFEALAQQAWFLEVVQGRMTELEPYVEALPQRLRALSPLLAPASDRNHERWGIYGQKYAPYVTDKASVEPHSFDEHVDYLLQWTDKRWRRMEQAIRHSLDRLA
jgi:hypothetical protein